MRSSISRRLFPLALAIGITAGAQTLQVYSEFTRVDPFGNIVRADRGGPPREILSPALPRNATTGFHLVVTAEPGAAYTLYVGQNPENTVAPRLYREKYVRQAGGWVPDALEAVDLPYRGRLETAGIEGQTSQAFWLDLRVPREAAVQRFKLEPEASFADRWAHYPMEARIVERSAPSPAGLEPPVSPAPVGSPSDITVRKVLRAKLCGVPEKFPAASGLTIRDFIARGAAQDLAMASALQPNVLWETIDVRDRAAWCKSDEPHPDGPEWYLRLRGRIIGAKQ